MDRVRTVLSEASQSHSAEDVLKSKNGDPLFNVELPSNAKEKEVVQPYFSDRLKVCQYTKDFASEMVDMHDRVAFGSRKPDIVHFKKGCVGSSLLITAVGDVKGRRSSLSFSSDEKGVAVDFALNLLTHQLRRTEIWSYVTDGHDITFFHVTAEGPRVVGGHAVHLP